MDQHRGTSQFPVIPETDPVNELEPAHPIPKVHRHRHPDPQPRGVGIREENDPYTKEQPPVQHSSAACLPDEQQFETGIGADVGVLSQMNMDGSEPEEQPGNGCSPASQQIQQQRSALRGPAGDVREPRQQAARQHAGNNRLDAAGGFGEAAPDRQQQASSYVAPATSEAETTCIDGRVATLKGENDEDAVDQAHGAEALSDGRQHRLSPLAKQGGASAHKSDRDRAFTVEEQPLRNRSPAAAAEERPKKGSKPRKLNKKTAEAGKAGTVAQPTRGAGNSKKPAAAARRGSPPAHRAKGEKKQARAGGNRTKGSAAKRNAVKEGAGQLSLKARQPDWLIDHSHAAADQVQASCKHRQCQKRCGVLV